MPTYQYRCTNCGHEIEAVQKFSDPALTTCDQCQGTLRKVFSPVGVVFKGSGFYATDSRSKNSASTSTPASSTPSSDAGTTATPAAASESKPAATPPSTPSPASSTDA